MKLVVFDIDGTLIRKTSVEDRCFVEAVAEELGEGEFETDWSTYRDVTDRGLVTELFERWRGRGPTPEELARIRGRYGSLLAERLRARPDQAMEIPGAAALVRTLVEGDGWRVAVATGNWRTVARFKWTRAGLPYPDLPMATSDDAAARSEILRLAMERAGRRYGRGPVEGIVSVGDGVWDLEAARALGVGFVRRGGVGWGGAEDARIPTLRDFRDRRRSMDLLEEASARSL